MYQLSDKNRQEAGITKLKDVCSQCVDAETAAVLPNLKSHLPVKFKLAGPARRITLELGEGRSVKFTGLGFVLGLILIFIGGFFSNELYVQNMDYVPTSIFFLILIFGSFIFAWFNLDQGFFFSRIRKNI